MATAREVLLQYRELCSYCDMFFMRVHNTHGSEMSCARGCADCCALETVCALEAAAIRSFMKQQGLGSPPHTASGQPAPGCAFLAGGACMVYPVRPIICRTHGLPMNVPGTGRRDSCPLNFTSTGLESLPESEVLDVARLTSNLMRLNIALCMVLGERELSGRRIRLRDVAEAALPPPQCDLEKL